MCKLEKSLIWLRLKNVQVGKMFINSRNLLRFKKCWQFEKKVINLEKCANWKNVQDFEKYSRILKRSWLKKCLWFQKNIQFFLLMFVNLQTSENS